jgi:hypothetical protein
MDRVRTVLLAVLDGSANRRPKSGIVELDFDL